MPAGSPDGNWMGPRRGISLRLFDIFMWYRRCSPSVFERLGRLINAPSNHLITKSKYAFGQLTPLTFGKFIKKDRAFVFLYNTHRRYN